MKKTILLFLTFINLAAAEIDIKKELNFKTAKNILSYSQSNKKIKIINFWAPW